jgi:hypothetical protein
MKSDFLKVHDRIYFLIFQIRGFLGIKTKNPFFKRTGKPKKGRNYNRDQI